MGGALTLVAGNPSARSGAAAEYIESAVLELRAAGRQVLRFDTLPGGATVEALKRKILETRAQVVISLGGDGTFNEVARAILAATRLGQAATMGMLPMGTANNQGRSFGMSAGADALRANVAVILAGHLTQLDVGKIQRIDDAGEPDAAIEFFDSVGWGMQPEILLQRNADRARVEKIPIVRDLYRDQLVYAGATLAKLLESYVEPVKFDAEITSEHTTRSYERMTDIVISNTALYAGEWVVDRDSEPDDGRFELATFAGRRDWMLKGVLDLASHRIRQGDIENPVTDALGIASHQGYAAKDFEVELFRPGKGKLATQVDGEVWLSGTHFRVAVEAQKLPLLTPAGFIPPWR